MLGLKQLSVRDEAAVRKSFARSEVDPAFPFEWVESFERELLRRYATLLVRDPTSPR